jgi:hypothetical protein
MNRQLKWTTGVIALLGLAALRPYGLKFVAAKKLLDVELPRALAGEHKAIGGGPHASCDLVFALAHIEPPLKTAPADLTGPLVDFLLGEQRENGSWSVDEKRPPYTTSSHRTRMALLPATHVDRRNKQAVKAEYADAHVPFRPDDRQGRRRLDRSYVKDPVLVPTAYAMIVLSEARRKERGAAAEKAGGGEEG